MTGSRLAKMLSGLLNIHKPRALTSHDVVNRVRRLTRVTRAGHAGTLDPLASGVLIICLGQATRLSEYIAEGTKTYLATLRLGEETASYDAESEVTVTRPWEHITRADLEAALASFRGVISQLPPMYSAVKHHGKALYKFARRGLTIERAPRQVTIESCEVTRWEPPWADLRVICSGGTYIRTLAHDIGQALGTGAYLAGLVRERSGSFNLQDAVTLDELAAAGDDWPRCLLPMQAGLSHLPGYPVDAAQEREIMFGREISLPGAVGLRAFALNQNGRMVAILRSGSHEGMWQPEKVFQHE